MKKNLCAGILVMLPSFAKLKAQDPFYFQSNASYALAAYSGNHSNVLSFSGNQASLADARPFSIGISAERRFMLSELGDFHLAASLRSPSGGFGIMAKHSGFGGMNQSLVGLAYGRNLGQFLSAGIQFNHFGIKLPENYGSASLFSFEAGLIARVSEKFRSGLHVSNPLHLRFGPNREEFMPSSYSLGLGYDASPKFFMGLCAEKSTSLPVNVHAGIIYHPVEQVVLGLGLLTASNSFYFEAGFIKGITRIDLSASYHPQLGFTPGISLLVSRPPKKEF